MVRTFTAAPADYARPNPAIFPARVVEPPLPLGPITGFLMLLGRRTFWKYYGWELTPPLAALNTLDYMRMVHILEAVLPKNKDGVSFTMDLRSEEAFIRDLIEAPAGSPEFEAAFMKYPSYSDDIFLRGARAQQYVATVVEVPSFRSSSRLVEYAAGINGWQLPVKQDAAEVGNRARFREIAREAFAKVATVGYSTPDVDACVAVKEALMVLAARGWDSGYPYMTTTKLRDSWLRGWINSVGVKTVLFMFALF